MKDLCTVQTYTFALGLSGLLPMQKDTIPYGPRWVEPARCSTNSLWL